MFRFKHRELDQGESVRVGLKEGIEIGFGDHSQDGWLRLRLGGSSRSGVRLRVEVRGSLSSWLGGSVLQLRPRG